MYHHRAAFSTTSGFVGGCRSLFWVECLEAVLGAFGMELGTDLEADEASQSDLLKLAVCYALADVDADLIEALREARRKRAMVKADEGL
jgi:hypothetical protein